jgi:hypothetical protein
VRRLQQTTPGVGFRKRISKVGSDGILAVRGVHKRDFVFLYFRLIAGQIDFDGPVYEVAIADVVQYGDGSQREGQIE